MEEELTPTVEQPRRRTATGFVGSDIDMFFYGLSDDQADRKVLAWLLDWLVGW